MSRVLPWLKEHWYYVAAGVLAVIVFIYIARKSSSGGTPSAVDIAGAAGTTGGNPASQGGLNLTSGDLANLPPNLLPPNCPDGQVPEPTMVSGGAGMPSFLLGWKCVPAPTAAPPPAPGPPNCPPGTHPVTVPLGIADFFPPGGGPIVRPRGFICVPDNPITTPPPAPAPVPPAPAPPPPPAPPPAQRTQTVCSWPNWCGSLWGIAQHFYGNGALWPKIYAANQGLIGGNPNLIHPGQNLIIP